MNTMDQALFEVTVRRLVMLASALIAAPVALLVVAIILVFAFYNGQGLAPPSGLPVVSLLAIGLLVLDAPLAFLLPNLQTQSALRQLAAGDPVVLPGVQSGPDVPRLLALRQTTLLVSLGILAGSAILSGVAFLLEGQVWVLLVAAVALLLMAVQFPTAGRVRGWLEQKRVQLEDLRGRRGVSVQ